MKFGKIWAVSCVLFGCGSEQGAPLGDRGIDEVGQEIRNGWVDSANAYPDVVKLEFVNASGTLGWCTGTLVAPSRVLTAAHCMAWITGPFGVNVYYGGGSRYAVSGRIHPLYSTALNYVTHPWIPGATHQIGIPDGPDLATLDLNASIPVTPRAIATSPVPWGWVIRVVGYGEIATGTTPLERRYGYEHVTLRLPLVKFATPVMPNGTLVMTVWSPGHVGCPGDSGGPALGQNGEVVAVMSTMLSGGGGGCNNAIANSLSTTQDFRTWILQSGTTLAYHEYALPPDVNNDGVVTEADSSLVLDAIQTESGLSAGSFAYRDTTADDALTTADSDYVLNVLSRSDSEGYTLSDSP